MQKQNEFIEIIKQNEGIIFKVTLVYSSNKEEQKDLYQEIVFQLWKSYDSFRNESKISTWLYRIALNTAITYLKKQNKRTFASLDDANNALENQLRADDYFDGNKAQIQLQKVLFFHKDQKQNLSLMTQQTVQVILVLAY